jgi:uncharacterized iron-regulated membrane protein
VQVLVDPYANRVLTSVVPAAGWGDFVRQLHVRFLYGSFWGRYIVGFFGITLLFSTISGLVIFRRFNAGSWKPKLRLQRGARIATADLHKLVGLGSVAFNIVFGLSGAVLGLEGVYHKYIAAKTPATRGTIVSALEDGAIQRCLASARTLVRNAEPVSLVLSYPRNGSVKVDMVHFDGNLIRENASYVRFDAKSLEPIEVYDASRAPLGLRFYYAMEPLHFGRFGGSTIVKLLWGLMGLAGGFLSITGFCIYFLRLRKRRFAPQRDLAPDARETIVEEISLAIPRNYG